MAGSALALSGDMEASARELAEGLALRRRIVAADARPSYRLELASAEETLARALLLAGNGPGAAEHARAGVGIAQDLVMNDAGDLAAQRQLARLRVQLGDALGKGGDAEGAVAVYHANQQAAARLALSHADDTLWPALEVTSLLRIATVRTQQSRPEEQEAAFQAALGIAERLVSGGRADAQMRRNLVDARIGLGTVALGRGEAVTAVTQFRRAVEVADALVAERPDDVFVRASKAIAEAYLRIAGAGIPAATP